MTPQDVSDGFVNHQQLWGVIQQGKVEDEYLALMDSVLAKVRIVAMFVLTCTRSCELMSLVSAHSLRVQNASMEPLGRSL